MPDSNKPYLNPDVLARISDLELRARFVVEGVVNGMHASPYQGHSIEFAQHREYVPGDDLRHLDWRVYGKSDRFYIKQYEEETDLRAHLVLDCSASMRYPEHPVESGRLTKFEYAATFAASLAYLLTQQQDAVGLLLFDDAVRDEVQPLSNQAHLQAIIHHLEQARLDRPTDARLSFAQVAGRLRRRSVVVLISDLLADVDDVIAGIERMRQTNHEVIVAHVLDQDERTFPFMDNTLFEGIEAAGTELFVDPQSLRSGYLEALNRHLERIRSACINQRADYLPLSTGEPIDVALRQYLAARSHRVKARA